MYRDQFAVRIVGGREVAGGYVKIEHGRKYKLSLRNDRNVSCDAEVHIDGKHVGTWRIWANSQISLERPAEDTGIFTFYRAGSSEAHHACLDSVPRHDLGLISVTFKPEKQAREVVAVAGASSWHSTAANEGYTTQYTHTRGGERSRTMIGGSTGMSPGGTGLSGQSDQRFRTVRNLQYDPAQFVTINLRLVEDNNTPRPLRPVSTPVPPPV